MKKPIQFIILFSFVAASDMLKAEQYGGIVIDLPSRWEQQKKGEFLYLYPPDFAGKEMLVVISVKNTVPVDLRLWLEDNCVYTPFALAIPRHQPRRNIPTNIGA